MSAATAARPAGIGIGLECGRLRAVPAGRPDLGCFAVQAGNSAFDGGPFQHDPVRMRERPALSRQGAGLSSGGAAPLDEDDPGRPARRALRDAPASCSERPAEGMPAGARPARRAAASLRRAA